MLGKVLFVIEQYCGGNPQWGPSNWDPLIVQTLRHSGLTETIELFYYDVLSRQFGLAAMGELLLEVSGKEQPDLIIIIPGGWVNLDPPRSIINIMTNTLGMKVLMIRSDSGGEEGHRWTNTWFPFVSFIVFIDATLGHLGYGQHPQAIQGFSPPYTNYYFNDKRLKRDIDVSFVGTTQNWPRRAEYIEFLRQQGVNIVTRGGQMSDLISGEEYAGIIKRSKISLNFCLHPGDSTHSEGIPQLKGRVFDITACRILLLEDKGTETREFFEEGKDFVMASSKEEMLEKVNYYLRHDEERERIATSGYRKTTKLYNASNFWGYALSQMGFEIPHSLAQDRYYQKLYRKLESLSK